MGYSVFLGLFVHTSASDQKCDLNNILCLNILLVSAPFLPFHFVLGSFANSWITYILCTFPE